jgi:hypothetical protein
VRLLSTTELEVRVSAALGATHAAHLARPDGVSDLKLGQTTYENYGHIADVEPERESYAAVVRSDLWGGPVWYGADVVPAASRWDRRG